MNNLRVLRAERNLAQYQLAKLAHIEATRFWRIEHGLVEPTDDERQRIAGALSAPQRRIWPNVRKQQGQGVAPAAYAATA